MPEYINEWEGFIASAHEGLLTDDELTQLAEKKATPETIKKYIGLQEQIGERLMNTGQPLVKKFSAEVLEQAFSKAAPPIIQKAK
jgi:hypothetical protein